MINELREFVSMKLYSAKEAEPADNEEYLDEWYEKQTTIIDGLEAADVFLNSAKWSLDKEQFELGEKVAALLYTELLELINMGVADEIQIQKERFYHQFD